MNISLRCNLRRTKEELLTSQIKNNITIVLIIQSPTTFIQIQEHLNKYKFFLTKFLGRLSSYNAFILSKLVILGGLQIIRSCDVK